MKKVILTILALAVVAVVATAALAKGPGRGPGYGPCSRGEFGGFAGVDLTADQKAKLAQMRDSRFKEIEPLREKMFSKRDEVRKLWLEPNPDQGKIAAAQKEMRGMRDEMQDKMTAFRLESLKVLTPEQKEKMKSFSSRRGFGPAKGKGPGMMGGWGGSASCFGDGPGPRGRR